MNVSILFKLKAFLLFSSAVLTMPVFSADLALVRKSYSTKLISIGKSPQTYENENPPAGVKEVLYQSGNLQLKAWMSPIVKSAGNSPAIVFLHGGFSFGKEDWIAAQEFVKAGFVLMMPTLRAENGNNGNFEMFGGEVDDAISAGKYLIRLANIDPNRVFIAGHSVGGSIAILVSEMDTPFRASAAFSGYPRLLDWLGHYKQIAPFDLSNEQERAIRNPFLYASNVRVPLYLSSESENKLTIATNMEFCQLVKQTSNCKHEIIVGNHESMIVPSTKGAIAFFNAVGK
jgi:dienelactone hydrolase